jgi:hypothetical protein
MPKDEFDFADPFELNGMAFATEEDTTREMAECFVVEFMRMGYNAKQILALFRNPQYLGPNMALQKRGEPSVRDLIADVFARRGRPVSWRGLDATHDAKAQDALADAGRCVPTAPHLNSQTLDDVVGGGQGAQGTARPAFGAEPLDPMGVPAPQLNL